MKAYIAALIVSVLGFACIALTGCASLGATVKEHQSTADLVAQLATVKFIQDKPKAEQAARAERIRDAIAKVSKVVSEESVTLQRVAQLFITYTDNLSPEEKVLALAFIKALQDELQRSIGMGELNSDSLIVLRTLFASIDTTASLFAP